MLIFTKMEKQYADKIYSRTHNEYKIKSKAECKKELAIITSLITRRKDNNSNYFTLFLIFIPFVLATLSLLGLEEGESAWFFYRQIPSPFLPIGMGIVIILGLMLAHALEQRVIQELDIRKSILKDFIENGPAVHVSITTSEGGKIMNWSEKLQVKSIETVRKECNEIEESKRKDELISVSTVIEGNRVFSIWTVVITIFFAYMGVIVPLLETVLKANENLRVNLTLGGGLIITIVLILFNIYYYADGVNKLRKQAILEEMVNSSPKVQTSGEGKQPGDGGTTEETK